MQIRKFEYKGPIVSFNNVACDKWCATTYAISRKKAINNLEYQARKFLGKNQRNKITLPGEILEDNS